MTNNGISVVIATLGNPTILDTINSLNSGTIFPDEILLCIPKSYSNNLISYSNIKNVKIIETEITGQVGQRAVGFLNAICDYVLQIDDDVVLEKNCLEILLLFMRKAQNSIAISPVLVTKNFNLSVYRSSRNFVKKYFFKPIYYFLINGTKLYRPGTVTSAGTQIGIDPFSYQIEMIPTEWLPGGCVLHNKKNLILYNFYPFEGKAYLEDLYHSYFLSLKSIKFFIIKSAVAKIVDPRDEIQYNLKKYFKELRKDYTARKYFIEMSKRNKLNLNIYYFLEILKIIILKMRF